MPSQRQQSRGRECFPAPSSASPTALHVERGQSVPGSRQLDCAGISCRQGLGCPRHPNLSARVYCQQRHADEPGVPRQTTRSATCTLYLAALPTQLRQDRTPVACLRKPHALPRRAMTRTVSLGPAAGIKKVPFAVIRPIWPSPNQPRNLPIAKPGSTVSVISAETTRPILERTIAIPTLQFRMSAKSRMKRVLSCRHSAGESSKHAKFVGR